MNKIRELRKQKKMTQKELSDFLQIADSTLSNWERGSFEPDRESIIRIADFFGVSTDCILGHQENKKPDTFESAGLTETEIEYIRMYRDASPELQVAAVAMLEAAERSRLARDSSAEEE